MSQKYVTFRHQDTSTSIDLITGVLLMENFSPSSGAAAIYVNMNVATAINHRVSKRHNGAEGKSGFFKSWES